MSAEISVVMPTFRRGALLKDPIESAFVQHVPIIVFDDCAECLAETVAKGLGSIDYRRVFDAQQAIGRQVDLPAAEQ
jgi:hypothetical protein